jgi:polyisoprenoid-binding protein YceI
VLIGDLTIHGVTQKIEINCRINKIGEEVILRGDFTVAPEDFDIDIPKLVMSKIAKEIQISFNYTLKP